MTISTFPPDQLAGTAKRESDAVSFADLGVPEDLVETLAADGIIEPFPIQALTVRDALAGRDVCGKAQTGSGKTLAFGIPMIERTATAQPRRPQSLVLAPTRELANQIAEHLLPMACTRGLWLATVYGGVSMNRQIDALKEGVDIVIGTPGRINDLLARKEMFVSDVQFVVIDEADHMADIGFLPQVERILRGIPGKPQTLLFSATLDGAVGALVRRYQTDPVHHAVESETDTVDTMEHRFIAVSEGDKVKAAAAICRGSRKTLLFVPTQRGADRLARDLAREGIPAKAIHGGLSQQQRERALEQFSSGKEPVLVATNVAARGLDVDAIDIVVQYDPPEDWKTYIHRSGRTARAGETGLVVTLVTPGQIPIVGMLRRQAGIREQVVKMTPDDPRLLDLTTWQPPLDEPFARRRSALNSPYVMSGEALRRDGPAPIFKGPSGGRGFRPRRRR